MKGSTIKSIVRRRIFLGEAECAVLDRSVEGGRVILCVVRGVCGTWCVWYMVCVVRGVSGTWCAVYGVNTYLCTK